MWVIKVSKRVYFSESQGRKRIKGRGSAERYIILTGFGSDVSSRRGGTVTVSKTMITSKSTVYVISIDVLSELSLV